MNKNQIAIIPFCPVVMNWGFLENWKSTASK